jgi:tetratricopeptide (TPR) repeat protein
MSSGKTQKKEKKKNEHQTQMKKTENSLQFCVCCVCGIRGSLFDPLLPDSYCGAKTLIATIGKSAKASSPGRFRKSRSQPPGGRGSWFGRRLASWSIAVGTLLAWSWWPSGSLSGLHGASGPSALLAAEPPALEPGTMPGPGVAPSQVEAAALKKEALVVAQQAAEAYPNDALTQALVGSAYYNTGKSEEATRHLQRCLELSPGQGEAYEILARVAYEKGQLEEAVRLCQEALKRGSANPEVLNQLGRALMDLGRAGEAIQTLERAVELPRPASESYYLLGQANLQSRNYAQAKESFQKAVASHPEHTQAYFGLYTVCLRLGQADEAERYRQQFVKLEASDRRTLTDRNAQEDTLSGLAMVRKTVARTIFGAGQVYHIHEQNGKAAELFRRAAELDGENPMYRAALEANYVQSKTLEEGLAVFEQLAKEQPDNSLNQYFLGRMYGRLQQIDSAERAFRKVQELTPQWPEGFRALAELYLRANVKPAEARAMARRASELEPTGPHYYLLAVACVKGDDRTGALEAIQKAVALSPGEKKYADLLRQLRDQP